MLNQEFTNYIWEKGRQFSRTMPWRDDTRPYYVLVSELMLQQTQVSRVIPKFEAFISQFPDERSLAGASLADVLIAWQGLGYNRRAKYLHDAAKKIQEEFNNTFPENETAILSLPGVGKNTLGAILAYSFNRPAIFIETNIRTVYIHHFFEDADTITDRQIIERLEETIDREHPREFYWALMDYGSWLKTNGVRNIARSKHYKKQAPLEGSVRQVRGQIIQALGHDSYKLEILQDLVVNDERFVVALNGLLEEGLITETDGLFHLTK